MAGSHIGSGAPVGFDSVAQHAAGGSPRLKGFTFGAVPNTSRARDSNAAAAASM